MNTYDVSKARVSSITSTSEMSSSTSEKPRRRSRPRQLTRRLWRPADIIIITEALFAEICREAALERRAVFGPADRERDADFSQLSRRGRDQRGEAAVQTEGRRERGGEPLARQRRGEVHRLGLRG